MSHFWFQTSNQNQNPKYKHQNTTLKALLHLDDLASVCRLMKNVSKTLAHVEYVMGQF